MSVAQPQSERGGVLPPAGTERVTIVEPRKGWASLDLEELWAYRDLLITLAARDIKLRYRQTSLGILWVIAQPLLTSLIFTVVFGLLAKMPSEKGPYFLLAFAGNIGWQAFSVTLTKANVSMVQNAHLVSKIYFPRLILPLSTVFSTLIDFGVSLVLMMILMVVFGVPFTPALLALPLWLLLIVGLATGIGMYAAALTVSYRDIQYVLPVALQLAMYATPVGYSISSPLAKGLPAIVKVFWQINPLTPLMEGMRWSLLGMEPPSWGAVAYAAGFSAAALILGAYTFRNMERRFADVI